MTIPLLHDWKEKIGENVTGLFPLGDGKTIPSGWKLQPRECNPKGLPTPLARAEAMKHVLRGIDQEGVTEHDMADRFRLLAFGVVLGHLEIRIVDMKSPEFDNLGRAVFLAEPNARYTALLSRRTDAGEVIFGASHPDCLFWPHARRTDADWKQLSSLIAPGERLARKLLAEFRDALKAAQVWNPVLIDWQKGIQWLTGNEEASTTLEEVRKNSRLAGPVVLWAHSNSVEKPRKLTAVYIPVSDPGYAERFIGYLNMSPPERTANGIELYDAIHTSLACISVPDPGADVDPVAMGIGIVKMMPVTDIQPPKHRELRVLGDDGLLKMLRPVENALKNSQYGSPVLQSLARQSPVLFPDPIRILADMSLWRAEGETEAVSFSKRCQAISLGEGGFGRLPDPSTIGERDGMVVQMKADKGAVKFAYLDSYENRSIGDLRALGYVLFKLFTGEAEVEEGGLEIVDQKTRDPLLRTSPQSPFFAVNDVYDVVKNPVEGGMIGRRLATLQQFVRTYEAWKAEGDIGALLAAAARSLAAWANDGRAVIPLGPAGKKARKLKIAGGDEAEIAVSQFIA